MVLITLAVLGTLAAAFIAVYWKNIVGWIQRVWNKLTDRINGVIEGVKTFIVKTKDGFKNATTYYSRNKITGEWEQTQITKSVDESEIPKDIMKKIKNAREGTIVETTGELLKLTRK